MINPSTSSISNDTNRSNGSGSSQEVDSVYSLPMHKSDESACSQGVGRVLGLQDIFTTPNALTRSSLANKGSSCDEMCIQFDGKEYICRICHGGNSSGDLLTPCKCKGSIALAHLSCLEIWLNESNRNECELCQYHFRVIRQPKYGLLPSIFIFLRHPGEHLRELLVDFVTLVVYTPSTLTSTYMLMLLCEQLAKSSTKVRKTFLSHVMAFTAIFGKWDSNPEGAWYGPELACEFSFPLFPQPRGCLLRHSNRRLLAADGHHAVFFYIQAAIGVAAINFTYTSWLVLTLEKYAYYWREWYKRNCNLRVILSATKLSAIEHLNIPPANRENNRPSSTNLSE